MGQTLREGGGWRGGGTQQFVIDNGDYLTSAPFLQLVCGSFPEKKTLYTSAE